MKASDIWVNKFKSLNEDMESLARQQAELGSKHKWGEMKKLQPVDQLSQNLEHTFRHVPHTAACEYCCTNNLALHMHVSSLSHI